MKRMINWLEEKLFRSKSINPPSNTERTKPEKDDLNLPKDMQDLVDDMPKPDNASDADN